jgi:hypothetical protein
MKRLLSVAALVLAGQVQATGAYVSGSMLLEWCKDDEPLCVTYIAGVVDSYGTLQGSTGGQTLCTPEGVLVGQLASVVENYLRDNPQQLNYGAASQVLPAIRGAYPCESPTPSMGDYSPLFPSTAHPPTL